MKKMNIFDDVEADILVSGENKNSQPNWEDEPRIVETDQFIGIFPNAINDELSTDFLNWFNEVDKAQLTMPSSALAHTGLNEVGRKDVVVSIPVSLPANMFPSELCRPLWQNISECLNIYRSEYMLQDRTTSSNMFNAMRVYPSGGYHIWHHEHSFIMPYRLLAWHLIIEAPAEGGETEFIFQQRRIPPAVGQLTIWPAGFTHKHRGNPPLKGQKTYLTGWFDEENTISDTTRP